MGIRCIQIPLSAQLIPEEIFALRGFCLGKKVTLLKKRRFETFVRMRCNIFMAQASFPSSQPENPRNFLPCGRHHLGLKNQLAQRWG